MSAIKHEKHERPFSQNVILKPNTNEKKLNWFQKAFETNQ